MKIIKNEKTNFEDQLFPGPKGNPHLNKQILHTKVDMVDEQLDRQQKQIDMLEKKVKELEQKVSSLFTHNTRY